MTRHNFWRATVRILAPLLIASGAALAQMGGGMGAGASASGSSMMMQDLTIGPDGTLYVVRPVQMTPPGSGNSSSQMRAVKHELVAINPSNGVLRWRLELNGERVSQPVVGKDNKIFLSLDDGYSMAWQGNRSNNGGGMMNPGNNSASNQSKLLVITATDTAATILATVTVDSDILGSPQMQSTGSGATDYVVYLTGQEMPNTQHMQQDDRDSIPAGEKTLYALLPDGKVKFKIAIGKSAPGMIP